MQITRAIIVRGWQLVQPRAVSSCWHRCKTMRYSLFAFQAGNASPCPWWWFCMVANLAALLLSPFHHCLSYMRCQSVLPWLEMTTPHCVWNVISHFLAGERTGSWASEYLLGFFCLFVLKDTFLHSWAQLGGETHGPWPIQQKKGLNPPLVKMNLNQWVVEAGWWRLLVVTDT